MSILDDILQRVRSFEPKENPYIAFVIYLIGCSVSIFAGLIIPWIAFGALLLPVLIIVFRAPIIIFFRTQFRLSEMLGAILFAGLCASLSTAVILSQKGEAVGYTSAIITWVFLPFVSVMVGSAWAWKKICDHAISNSWHRWNLLTTGWIYAMIGPLVIAFFWVLLPVRH